MVYDQHMLETILTQLRHELLTRAPLDALPPGVWRRTGALNTWGTNAIEGNTLTRKDVERILLEGRSVSNRSLPDVLETIQHERAFESLLRRRTDPIRLSSVLDLHDTVFRGIKPDAGQWRRVNVRIAGVRHVPPRSTDAPRVRVDPPVQRRKWPGRSTPPEPSLPETQLAARPHPPSGSVSIPRVAQGGSHGRPPGPRGVPHRRDGALLARPARPGRDHRGRAQAIEEDGRAGPVLRQVPRSSGGPGETAGNPDCG